ncbi:carbohydrate ABC transporter permease [Agromyces endophyticus]|uniref:carbohydrate ABC transporter permease n=1 Tax=Agromyces sp. H17E-10 TaxID=2932244 RepID=UPI001FD61073|nr:carbohydrate ABC transporter permease [Agromyces sp. H17E-10]UOQ88094.1 carbohydrate ABC transporter permease [Agromyces sp. H17E-10]
MSTDTMIEADAASRRSSEASGSTAVGVRRSRRTARKTRAAAGKAVLVVVLLAFTLFPAFWMLSSAFDAQAGAGGQQLLPREWSLSNFEYVLTEGGFDVFLRNSAIVALVTVLASALLALLASVAVARFRFRFRTAMLLMILVVQMVPLEALVIPLFVQVRDLQLLNTLLGLMVVYVALSLPFGIWMLRGFVAAVPVELEEAAYIDGASWGRMFRSVLLPLVMPGLVATSVFSFITAWNEFIFAMTLLGGATENYTVAIGLKQFFGEHSNEWGYIMAASTIITIPVMIFFVIVQRRLSSGLVAGAVKG